MTRRRLEVAVSGIDDRSRQMATVINDTASEFFTSSDDAPSISTQAMPAELIGAAHHLVVAVGAEQTAWSDLSITSNGDARALAKDRLVPWATRWQQGRRAPRARTAVLADADPTWAPTAARLIARLHAHTAQLPVVRIDHIGSTSVAGLAAKNLIDIQITIPSDADALAVAEAATGAGFVHVSGEWFGKDRNGELHPEQVCVDADPGRPVNINIRSGSRPVARDALLFRDWLRANPPGRNRYLAMKTELAGRHVDDYGESKELFISAALRQAETWASQNSWAH